MEGVRQVGSVQSWIEDPWMKMQESQRECGLAGRDEMFEKDQDFSRGRF